MRTARSFPVGLFLVLMACHSSPIEAGRGRVVGTIDAGGTLDRVIEAPSVVSRGRAFTITVSTFGNSCVTPAGADVTIDGLIATITPYDVVGGGICLDYLKPYPRALQLSFGQAGAATIRVKGVSVYQSGFVAVERSLVVSQ
jgi:hypothetical protein